MIPVLLHASTSALLAWMMHGGCLVCHRLMFLVELSSAFLDEWGGLRPVHSTQLFVAHSMKILSWSSLQWSSYPQDASRPLRRVLKQYGSGSLEAGVKAIRSSTDAVAELVRLLDVDSQVRHCHCFPKTAINVSLLAALMSIPLRWLAAG